MELEDATICMGYRTYRQVLVSPTKHRSIFIGVSHANPDRAEGRSLFIQIA